MTHLCSPIYTNEYKKFIDLIYLIRSDKKGNDLYHFIKQNKDLYHITKTIKDTTNKTALHIAAIEKSLIAVKLLLKLGINYNAVDTDGNTPLHYACMLDDLETIQLFIEKKQLNVNIKNKMDFTPLDILIFYGSLESINLLLNCNGINPHLIDSMERTYLHKATFRDLKTLNVFIEAGIDINKKDSLGKTALHYASHYKKIDMVESLLLKGADYTITDSHNKTAIDEATTPEIIDIINEYKNQQDTQKEYSDAQNQNNYEFNVNLAGDLQND